MQDPGPGGRDVLSRARRRAWIVRGLVVAVAGPCCVLLVLRVLPPPVTPFMLLRSVTAWVGIDYHWVPLSAMSSHVSRAVIAAEDARFMQHHGFDWVELAAAVKERGRTGRLRGASTISMQCARLLFLWPGRDIVRKALEVYLTLYVEALWPKARILETYLNVVEWGDGVYGCEAAARRYFGRPCSALDAGQAARLAAVLPNPHRWSPARPSRYILARTATILRRMPQVDTPR